MPSKDMDIIDNSLASSLQAVNSSLVGFIAAILTVWLVLRHSPLFWRERGLTVQS